MMKSFAAANEYAICGYFCGEIIFRETALEKTSQRTWQKVPRGLPWILLLGGIYEVDSGWQSSG